MEDSDEILVPIRFECEDCWKNFEFISRLKNNNMTKIDCENYEISIIEKRVGKKYEFKILILCKKCNSQQKIIFGSKSNKSQFKCQNCPYLNGFFIYYQILDNEIDSNPKRIKVKFINSDDIEHTFNFFNSDSIENKYNEIKSIFKRINPSTKFYFNSDPINKSQSFEQNKIYDGCEIEIDDE